MDMQTNKRNEIAIVGQKWKRNGMMMPREETNKIFVRDACSSLEIVYTQNTHK